MKQTSGTGAPRRSGFTLVELIIVIAILAILAGVAIPVYRGYVIKAGEAADIQLISAVNTAFAASCLENGTDAKAVTCAELVFTIGEDGKSRITGVTNVMGAGLDGGKVRESFEKYFGDNANTSLKYYKPEEITYQSSLGVFAAGTIDGAAPAGTILDSGHVWQNYAAAVAAYDESNWKNMGVDGLTETVDHLTNALKVYGNMRNVLSEAEDFRQELLDEFGISFDEADNATLANATVFYVAKRLQTADAEALKTALDNDSLESALASEDAGHDVNITTNLDNYLKSIGIDDSVNHREYQLVTATLKYALAVSYVYSENGNVVVNENTGETLRDRVTTTQLSNYGSVIGLYNEVQKQPGYTAYLVSDTAGATADLDAFTSILGVLDGNKEAFLDITGSSLFSSAEVQAAINSLLGSSGGENG